MRNPEAVISNPEEGNYVKKLSFEFSKLYLIDSLNYEGIFKLTEDNVEPNAF